MWSVPLFHIVSLQVVSSLTILVVLKMFFSASPLFPLLSQCDGYLGATCGRRLWLLRALPAMGQECTCNLDLGLAGLQGSCLKRSHSSTVFNLPILFIQIEHRHLVW